MSIVSMSMTWMSLKPVSAKLARISHPSPPAPMTRILALVRRNSLTWMGHRHAMMSACGGSRGDDLHHRQPGKPGLCGDQECRESGRCGSNGRPNLASLQLPWLKSVRWGAVKDALFASPPDIIVIMSSHCLFEPRRGTDICHKDTSQEPTHSFLHPPSCPLLPNPRPSWPTAMATGPATAIIAFPGPSAPSKLSRLRANHLGFSPIGGFSLALGSTSC